MLPLWNFLACIYSCVLLFRVFWGFFLPLLGRGKPRLGEAEGGGRCCPSAWKVPLRCKATFRLASGGISKSWVGNASCPPSFLRSGQQLDLILCVDFLAQKSRFWGTDVCVL